MMKKIWYILIVGCLLGLFACNDVEVGYLDVENAAYAKDSMLLYKVEDRLVEYKEIYAQYNERVSDLNDLVADLEEQYDDIQYSSEYDDASYYYGEAMYILENEDPNDEFAIADTTTYGPIYRDLKAQLDLLEDKKYETKDLIDNAAQEFGYTSAEVLENDMAGLENRIKYQSPWITQPIESVLGTEPLSFAIANVKNDNPGNAELFRKSLTIMGGGRMNIPIDFKAPAGRYVVSILIENEGQCRVLEDVFTFIVDK